MKESLNILRDRLARAVGGIQTHKDRIRTSKEHIKLYEREMADLEQAIEVLSVVCGTEDDKLLDD